MPSVDMRPVVIPLNELSSVNCDIGLIFNRYFLILLLSYEIIALLVSYSETNVSSCI